MRHYFKSLLLLLTSYYTLSAQREMIIPYAPELVKIDGNLKEWQLPLHIPQKRETKYKNQISCGLYWNHTYLFVAFNVTDHYLCTNEAGDGNPRLYLNDAVEIYLDAKNDSHDKMDLNDYQFLVSITGHKVIFKGDKSQMAAGNSVPKDHETANILIESGVMVLGTINNNKDTDQGYQIEVAIPWNTIGVVPYDGFIFKLDLCQDDVDTTAMMTTWPEDFHTEALHYANLDGSADFGFPQNWYQARLTGRPDLWYQWSTLYSGLPAYVMYLFIGIIPIIVLMVWSYYRKLRFFRHLPDKFNTIVSPLPREKVKPDDHEASRFRAYVEENIREDITVETVAKTLNIGVRQLQRIMQNQGNPSPKQYITIIKLEKASQLLLEGNLTVAEIAFACGFSDASYFGTVFKKHFGLTPMEYRKSRD